eukprot:GHVQ01004637.1.p1 GENE.GHVQ01004637.1~~GHVQ01004637.1.p1  ORF type:complete len:988 (+),score=148.00 GHVQ01004637.1:213-3176(+)
MKSPEKRSQIHSTFTVYPSLLSLRVLRHSHLNSCPVLFRFLFHSQRLQTVIISFTFLALCLYLHSLDCGPHLPVSRGIGPAPPKSRTDDAHGSTSAFSVQGCWARNHDSWLHQWNFGPSAELGSPRVTRHGVSVANSQSFFRGGWRGIDQQNCRVIVIDDVRNFHFPSSAAFLAFVSTRSSWPCRAPSPGMTHERDRHLSITMPSRRTFLRGMHGHRHDTIAFASLSYRCTIRNICGTSDIKHGLGVQSLPIDKESPGASASSESSEWQAEGEDVDSTPSEGEYSSDSDSYIQRVPSSGHAQETQPEDASESEPLHDFEEQFNRDEIRNRYAETKKGEEEEAGKDCMIPSMPVDNFLDKASSTTFGWTGEQGGRMNPYLNPFDTVPGMSDFPHEKESPGVPFYSYNCPPSLPIPPGATVIPADDPSAPPSHAAEDEDYDSHSPPVFFNTRTTPVAPSDSSAASSLSSSSQTPTSLNPITTEKMSSTSDSTSSPSVPVRSKRRPPIVDPPIDVSQYPPSHWGDFEGLEEIASRRYSPFLGRYDSPDYNEADGLPPPLWTGPSGRQYLPDGRQLAWRPDTGNMVDIGEPQNTLDIDDPEPRLRNRAKDGFKTVEDDSGEEKDEEPVNLTVKYDPDTGIDTDWDDDKRYPGWVRRYRKSRRLGIKEPPPKPGPPMKPSRPWYWPGNMMLKIYLFAHCERDLRRAYTMLQKGFDRLPRVARKSLRLGGPKPLKKKVKHFTLLKSAFVHKNARDQLRIEFHTKIVNIFRLPYLQPFTCECCGRQQKSEAEVRSEDGGCADEEQKVASPEKGDTDEPAMRKLLPRVGDDIIGTPPVSKFSLEDPFADWTYEQGAHMYDLSRFDGKKDTGEKIQSELEKLAKLGVSGRDEPSAVRGDYEAGMSTKDLQQQGALQGSFCRYCESDRIESVFTIPVPPSVGYQAYMMDVRAPIGRTHVRRITMHNRKWVSKYFEYKWVSIHDALVDSFGFLGGFAS